ncbi:hypothetical protein F511_40034 [Dorcoceras hygrometricum]|uniref:Uncharacterized protein n=1 Tax=Dorcoceras hygrometricum TaxID=472368 RepID=A0A2Z7ANR2_9LAMI|nr:hypothetical protein F511_40034 [Dorcoceras hygrometricum]
MHSMTFIGVPKEYLAGTCAWLQPELQERRLFTSALEELTRSVRTDSPGQNWPEQIPASRGGGGGGGGGL